MIHGHMNWVCTCLSPCKNINMLPATHKWRQLEPAVLTHPPARSNHAALAVNNYMVIFGGSNKQTYFNDVWACTPSGVWKQMTVVCIYIYSARLMSVCTEQCKTAISTSWSIDHICRWTYLDVWRLWRIKIH